MIKVSVFYPSGPGITFDMEYYLTKHFPMVRGLVGAACRNTSVEEGVGGGEPGSAPSYVAMGHMYFDSLEDFNASFVPHTAEIVADIPNYTNSQPVVQISTVRM